VMNWEGFKGSIHGLTAKILRIIRVPSKIRKEYSPNASLMPHRPARLNVE
jgi:hypothetical protein